MILRAIAGIFIGLIALSLVMGGIFCDKMSYIAVGAPMASAMLAFFIGEYNGQRKTEA